MRLLGRQLSGVALILTAMLFALCSSGDAQQAGKIYRIGVLSVGVPASSPDIEAFRQGLRELGYVQGKNVEYRYFEGKVERLPELADELVRLKVDIFVTIGRPPSQAAKSATTTIPIVMALISDPVGAGLVASLARPGGNVTGVSTVSTDLTGKRLEVLKETIPKAQRIAVLYDPKDPAKIAEAKETEVAARSLGVQLQFLEVRGLNEFDAAFKEATRVKAGSILVLPTGLTTTHRRRIAELAAKNLLPTMWATSRHMDAGGLLSYGPDYDDLYRRAATYVDKILKGANPADLPVEQPTKFELVINLKTAKQIGVIIPPNVLARADRVIR
jgi:putative ABC transport system substrate-binding protein